MWPGSLPGPGTKVPATSCEGVRAPRPVRIGHLDSWAQPPQCVGATVAARLAMHALVPSQHGRAREALAADLTGVGLLPGVRANVPAQVAGAPEALPAGRAAVWPLARVPHPVLHQLPLHVEGLATLVTGEYLVGRVCLLVLLQVAEVAEASTAGVAQVWLLPEWMMM